MKIKSLSFKQSVKISPVGDVAYLTADNISSKAINVTDSGNYIILTSPVECVAVPRENIRYLCIESEADTASEKSDVKASSLVNAKTKKQ